MSQHLKIAFLFPGQGSQSVGMGHDFYVAENTAKGVYHTFDRIVSETLDETLSKVCFEGPEETLKRTLYTQPAILATSLAALRLFNERLPQLYPTYAAGHSLGEYGALYAAGILDVETAATLIQKRAELMESAPTGAMSAVLGLAEEKVEAVLQQLNLSGKGPITVANYNTPDQLVISGAASAVEAAAPLLKDAGAKRVLPLPVGGAFHSPLMDKAASEFTDFLQSYSFGEAAFPVVTNVDAEPTISGQAFREKLGTQINHSVRWTQTMQRLFGELGVTVAVEFGPGKVLTGMVKKYYPDVALYNVFDMDSLDVTVAEVKQHLSTTAVLNINYSCSRE